MPTSSLSREWRRLLFVVVAALGVLSGHWTAETWWHWWHVEWFHHPSAPLGFAVTAVFLLVCPIALYKLRHVWRRPLAWFPFTNDPPRREALVWFLSPLNRPDDLGPRGGVPEWFEPTGALEADLAALEQHKTAGRLWQWEMPLRGVRHHLGRLRTLLLVVSRQSAPQAHHFLAFLGRYGELRGVRVRVLVRGDDGRAALADGSGPPLTADRGWDFEDFNILAEGVTAGLTALNHEGVGDDRIMIDFTGGQKVTSVVAAVVTFNRAVQAQYVSTNPPFAVRGYHLEWVDLRTEEFGLAE